MCIPSFPCICMYYPRFRRWYSRVDICGVWFCHLLCKLPLVFSCWYRMLCIIPSVLLNGINRQPCVLFLCFSCYFPLFNLLFLVIVIANYAYTVLLRAVLALTVLLLMYFRNVSPALSLVCTGNTLCHIVLSCPAIVPCRASVPPPFVLFSCGVVIVWCVLGLLGFQ